MEIKDLAGLSEPAKVLIEKCADALGAMAHPFQIKRVAKAEAEAEIIKAKSEVEVAKIKANGEIEQRALARLVHEEGKKQQNIENIVAKALPELKGDAKPDAIDEDWLSNFFDKCRLISDEEMQHLWGKVLAGEANAPGRFSKRTINLLQSMNRDEAASFQKLSRFFVDFQGYAERVPLIYHWNGDPYKKAKFYYQDIQNLLSMGLVTLDTFFGYKQDNLPPEFKIVYGNQNFKVRLPVDKTSLYTGKVSLTQTGCEIASLCSRDTVDGFFEYLEQIFAKHSWGEIEEDIQSAT